jgi:hypothetical protein
MRTYLRSDDISSRYALILGSCHDAKSFPHSAQSAWLGLAETDIDSAIKYRAPQDGQAISDIFIEHLTHCFLLTPTLLGTNWQ